jgi:predicted metal-dependent peptidase
MDFNGVGKSASHRDREAIVDDLKSNEDPEFLPVRRKNLPRRPASRPPAPPIRGWAYMDSMRDLKEKAPGARIPVELLSLWHTVEFEIDYESRHPQALMRVASDGTIRVRPYRQATFNEWLFCAVHLLYQVALGYVRPPEDCEDPHKWMMAAEMTVNQYVTAATMLPTPKDFPNPRGLTRASLFRQRFNGGALPVMQQIPSPAQRMEQWETSRFKPSGDEWRSPAGPQVWDIDELPPEVAQRFRNLYVREQVRLFKPQIDHRRKLKYANSVIARAHSWMQQRFPLLSAAAAQFEIDYTSAERYNIALGAVSVRDQVIYVNPEAELTEMEWRWVIAHEILHVVLEHMQRRGEREPFIWNVACDYVINNWLDHMGVGVRPEGTLFKEDYRGVDAETIYEELMRNGGNDQLKIVTLRGEGLSDMLDFDPDFNEGDQQPGQGRSSRFRPNVRQMTQNEARKMLQDEESGYGRGFLPGDLIEELDLTRFASERIEVPAWKTELAEWFAIQFIPKPPTRSYNRMSRRQASAPDIPLPGKAIVDYHSPTFGVVLDTSGSMSHDLLQTGMSAVVAYAERHGVAFVRLVMCDTRPYDEGFIPLETLKRPYQIMGRGGTVLQPSVDLLQKAKDFPQDAPLLIVTDGQIDVLKIERDHAFLLPSEGELPFEPVGPVFRILGENNSRGFPRRRSGSSSRFGSAPRSSPGSGTEDASSHREVVRNLIERLKNKKL